MLTAFHWLADNGLALLFGAMMMLIGAAGLLGIAYVLIMIVEAFLPDSWKPQNILYSRELAQIEAERIKRRDALKAIKKANPHMTTAEIIALKIASLPVTHVQLEKAIGEAMAQRSKENFYSGEKMSVTGEIDLSDEIKELVHERPKPLQVCIARFPLTPHCEYFLGMSRGGQRCIWGQRKLAKVFLSDSADLRAALKETGFDGIEVFVLKAHTGRTVERRSAIAKSATA